VLCCVPGAGQCNYGYCYYNAERRQTISLGISRELGIPNAEDCCKIRTLILSIIKITVQCPTPVKNVNDIIIAV
jgi:hypothetical protein